MIVVGIDPGANTGFAVYIGGELISLSTIDPVHIAEAIRNTRPDRVIFEDSRLTSFVFTTTLSRPTALKMARNVGQVDAWSRLITSVCELLSIPCLGISPKQKGKKLNSKEFSTLTGWTKKSNEHERDSAMVAWPYRNLSKSNH